MRPRALLVGLIATSTLLIAGPATAKADIVAARITGPGLEKGLTIEAPKVSGLWDSGIDAVGGLDDERADSAEELGLTEAELGPRYDVTYWFGHNHSEEIRQDLYPYATGGPVTYTPPGQEVVAGPTMPITAGWYRTSHPCQVCGVRPPPPEEAARHFFNYLVKQGLPETNPVPATNARSVAPQTRISTTFAVDAFLERAVHAATRFVQTLAHAMKALAHPVEALPHLS